VATPIGHALAAYAAYAADRFGAAGGGCSVDRVFLRACMALASDLDFVPGIVQSPHAQNVGGSTG
jgi:hypothetical protein